MTIPTVETNDILEGLTEIRDEVKNRELDKNPPYEKEEAYAVADRLGYQVTKVYDGHADVHFVADVVGPDEDPTTSIFKVNMEPALVARTLIEIEALGKIAGQLGPEFATPKLHDFGILSGKYVWLTREKFEGQPMELNKPEDIKALALLHVRLMRSSLSLPEKDKSRAALENGADESRQELLDRLMALAKSWSDQRGGKGAAVLPYVAQYPVQDRRIKPIPTHGELIPKHILKLESGQYGVFDWELAAGKYFHYDVPYTFHRLWTGFKGDGNPGIARDFLSEYLSLLNEEERYAFDKTFISMLAQRVIGGYFDYKREESIEHIRNFWLEKAILENRVLSQN